MRNKVLLSLAVAATLAASPAAAKMEEGEPGYVAPPAPEAADKTLGMALMSASVIAGCDQSRGAGLEGIEDISAGVCNVTFNRNVRDCTIVTGVGAFSGTVVDGHAQFNYISGAENDNIIQVETRNNANNPADISFHVIVFCAR
ncbi:hypothetical protein [Microbaculum marinum]|uniref:Lipoprotein n=1 Tax=Microbaculum marinum TaxID=1764581 RepID=A0AAW9RUU9_9HYPH